MKVAPEDLANWLDLLASPTLAIPIPITATAAKSLMGGPLILVGWAVRETSGAAPATVTLGDGLDANGLANLAADIGLPQSGSAASPAGTDGILCRVGLVIKTTGATSGVVYVKG